jgi:hypothetical protein
MQTQEQIKEALDVVLDVKHCVDCKHAIPDPGGTARHSLCRLANYETPPVDSEMSAWLVTGKGIKPKNSRGYFYCMTERESTGASSCGIDAKFFEPKDDQTTKQTNQ